MRVISRESNGDPHAINTWDSNAKAGIPSKGLAQIVPPNFELYKQNAHANIWNGYDNLYAAINYMKHRYGSDSAAFSRVAGGAYANGGLSITEKLAHISEGNKPEMIVPLVPTKATRAWELIGKAIGILSAQSGFNNQPVTNIKENKEEHEFRQSVLQLLERLVTRDSSANITLTTPEGRTLWKVVEPFYKDDQRTAQIKQRRGLSAGF
jgi:SLT domain-containing protein